MLSTSSYSKAIVQDNFKRNWSIPVMGFIAYGLIGLMPVLMSYRSFRNVAHYAENVMKCSAFFVNAVIVIIAIVTASAVFGYLHNQTSSNAMHAMPTDRSKLFVSAFVSGWVLMIIPLVVFGFSMLILRGATAEPVILQDESLEGLMFGGFATAKEIYTLPHVLAFIFTGVVNATYVFALACLAAVLAGKRVIHELLAFFILILPALIVMTVDSTMSEYLFGFSGLSVDYSWLGAPLAAMSKEDFGIHIGHTAYYVVLTIAILAASLWIYKNVKLERIGNSTTFPQVADVLVTLLTVLLSITFGNSFTLMLSTSQREKSMLCAIATIVSSILYYVIMRMIADGGPSIFNKKNMLKYLPCVGILIVMLVLTAFDITGFNTRMPVESDVESVHVSTYFPSGYFPQTDDEFSDPEAIESLMGLQKAIIEERDTEATDGYDSERLSLVWKLKNGRRIVRDYEIRKAKEYVKTGEALEKLFNTASFRKNLSIDIEKDLAKCKRVTFYVEDLESYDDIEEISIKKEDWRGLFEAVNKDLAALSYEDVRARSDLEITEPQITIQTTEQSKEDEFVNGRDTGYTINLRFKDKNTVDFLKSKGYMK